jgi:hypothetical protein
MCHCMCVDAAKCKFKCSQVAMHTCEKSVPHLAVFWSRRKGDIRQHLVG